MKGTRKADLREKVKMQCDGFLVKSFITVL